MLLVVEQQNCQKQHILHQEGVLEGEDLQTIVVCLGIGFVVWKMIWVVWEALSVNCCLTECICEEGLCNQITQNCISFDDGNVQSFFSDK